MKIRKCEECENYNRTGFNSKATPPDRISRAANKLKSYFTLNLNLNKSEC
jgi:hypothetical protein